MFRALLAHSQEALNKRHLVFAHSQEALNKRHLVCCVFVMSVGCTRIEVR
jgi:hypothetical protein